MSDVVRLDQSLRLLLVDDEPHLTDLLSEELVDQGYHVEVASTISEAWQFLNLEVLPELLVLDWSLPDGIGPDLCERMREDGIKIPVLMLIPPSSPTRQYPIHSILRKLAALFLAARCRVQANGG